MGRMWALRVVVGQPFADPNPRFRTRLKSVQGNAFILQRPPQPFDHPVVAPRAFSAHADAELAAYFKLVAAALAEGEDKILAELASGQGLAVNLDGYYRTDAGKTAAVMRPYATLNGIIG